MLRFSRHSREQSLSAAAHDAPARRLRVLVVDENAGALTAMGGRMPHLGYDVVLADSGFAALSLMIGQHFDAIIVDLAMQMLPGVETVRRMQASGLLGGAPIIVLSGSQDHATVPAALQAGADDHFAKPFDFDVLDAHIRRNVSRARQLAELERYNETLDARIARRAVELGEAREALEEMRLDRARLVASIQSLHDEVERLSAPG
jgi:DNA-binding response OmpR family regulator